MSPPPISEFRRFLAVLRAQLVVGLLLFLLGVGLFLAFTLPMDNDFAEEARRHHLGTVAWVHARTIPGYLLLSVAYAVLAWPLLRSRPAVKEGRRLGTLGLVLLADLLLFVLSLGPAAYGSPAFLDLLSRNLGPVLPDLDLYLFFEWKLREVFTGLVLLLAASAGWTALRRAGRGVRWGTMALAALALLAPLRGGPPGPRSAPAAATRPNLLIIASDSLRADHLSCYGYPRETSPTIDRLAREGIVLENLFVSTASTLESWATILCSRFPVSHGLRYMFPSRERVARVSALEDSLPRVLGRAGWHTAVSSNWAGNCFRLVDFGFEANHASDIQNLDVFLAEAALMAHWPWPLYLNNRLGEALYPAMRQLTSALDPPALQARLEAEVDRAAHEGHPWFGVIFSSATHLPYAASWPFNQRWVDRSYRGPNRYQIDFEVDGFIQHGFRDSLPPDQVQHIIDLYDGTVSEFDDAVRHVVESLEARGLLENTILVVTSDHGDDLYDPGTTLGHGTNFFGGDQTTRIPAVIRLPGRRHAGTRIPGLLRTVDLAPTLLDLLSLPVPAAWEGISFQPSFADPARDPGRPAFAETCYLFHPKKNHPPGSIALRPADETLFIDRSFDNNFVLKEAWHAPVIDAKDRMIRTARWKLVHIPGERGPILRLHDMLADPRQQQDLSGARLPVMTRLASHLDRWWAGETDLRWTLEDDDPGR